MLANMTFLSAASNRNASKYHGNRRKIPNFHSNSGSVWPENCMSILSAAAEFRSRRTNASRLSCRATPYMPYICRWKAKFFRPTIRAHQRSQFIVWCRQPICAREPAPGCRGYACTAKQLDGGSTIRFRAIMTRWLSLRKIELRAITFAEIGMAPCSIHGPAEALVNLFCADRFSFDCVSMYFFAFRIVCPVAHARCMPQIDTSKAGLDFRLNYNCTHE